MNAVLKKLLVVPVRLFSKLHLVLYRKYEKVLGLECLKGVVERGKPIKVEGYGIVHEPQQLRIGSHVFIGRNFFIRAKGGVSIGDYTHISRNVVIHTVNHNATGNLLPYDHSEVKKEVCIGRYVWIGMNVCILPGVRIGDGAIIGMGTVVSKDVLPGEIVVGAAQRVVGGRDSEVTRALVEKGKFLHLKAK